jgi:hypothetical protein
MHLLTLLSTVKCEEPYYQRRVLAVKATTTSFDIITDLMSKIIVPVLVYVLTSAVLIIPP